MTRHHENDSDLFGRCTAPEPPEGLKEQVLMAAREAGRKAQSRDLWTTLWWNPFARTLWLTAVVLLLFGHLLVQGRQEPVVQRAGHLQERELVEIATLPEIDLDLLPGGSFGSGSRDRDLHANNDQEKENSL